MILRIEQALQNVRQTFEQGEIRNRSFAYHSCIEILNDVGSFTSNNIPSFSIRPHAHAGISLEWNATDLYILLVVTGESDCVWVSTRRKDSKIWYVEEYTSEYLQLCLKGMYES